jgi:hypothetical protein
LCHLAGTTVEAVSMTWGHAFLNGKGIVSQRDGHLKG